jgi:cytochrome c biogenesis protein CcdA
VKIYFYLVLGLLLAVAAPCDAESSLRIEFSPPEWKYGMIGQGEIAEARVSAFNRGAESLELSFIPTCGCLRVSPSSARIPSGGSASFDLSFDSKDDAGITRRGFIVKSDLPGTKPLYYALSGVVRVDRPAAQAIGEARGEAPGGTPGEGSAASAGAKDALELRYYYMPGCRSCEEFLSAELPRLEERYAQRLAPARRDLLDAAAYEELAAFAASIGTTVKAVPALRVEGILLQGDEEIRSRLPGILATRAAGGSLALAVPSPKPGPAPGSGSATLSALPVMVAGLVDGINPCAFTTLIFLIASLALAGRGRREVLIIGSLFSLGVFLTYLGIGLGLFAALRAAAAVALVSTALRWALIAALLAFSALSVYDYFKIRSGKSAEMVLQLPAALKLRIHAAIRTSKARTGALAGALAGSSLALGFLVSVFEFACTGQVYLPTLAYLARERGRGDAVALLVLYNLCFIAPLLAVFVASYLGASSKRITQLFQRRMGAVKLALALVFLALAVLTIAA